MAVNPGLDKSARAREFLENGAYSEAASAFLSLGEYASAARALVCAKAYKEAAQCYEKAGKPLDAARLYLQVREWKKAAELYSQAGDKMRADLALEQFKKENPPKRPIIQPRQPSIPPLPPKEETIWPEGEIWQAVKKGDMDLAVQIYLKPGSKSGWILMQELKSKETLSSLAEMLFLARDYAVAGEAFRRLGDNMRSAMCLGLAGLYEEAADLYIRSGQKNLAAQHLEKAHQWSKAADIHREDGRFMEAAHCLEKLDEPVRAAAMYLKAGKADLALPLLQSVPPSHMHFSQCRLLAGKILFQKGQRELALSMLSPLYESEIEGEEGLETIYQLANLLEHGGEAGKAKEIYLKIQKNRFGYKDVEKRLDSLMATTSHPKDIEVKKEEANLDIDTSPLRDCSLFNRLGLNDLRHLWMIGRTITLKAGEVLLRKGENAEGLYIILQGGLSITSDPTNQKLAIGFLGRGDFVGLGSLVQGPPQPNSLVAQEGTIILILPKNDLEHLISTELELGLRLFRSISEHLVQTMMGQAKTKEV